MSTRAHPRPDPGQGLPAHAAEGAPRLLVTITTDTDPFATPLALEVAGLTSRQLADLIRSAVATHQRRAGGEP